MAYITARDYRSDHQRTSHASVDMDGTLASNSNNEAEPASTANNDIHCYNETAELYKERSFILLRKPNRNLKYFLTVKSLRSSKSNLPLGGLTRDITDLFPKTFPESTFCFLSVSGDGRYIAISSNMQVVDNEFCIIYTTESGHLLRSQISDSVKSKKGICSISRQWQSCDH